jgi:hypothetical protein
MGARTMQALFLHLPPPSPVWGGNKTKRPESLLLFFATNYKASDFMDDDLLLWRQYRKPKLARIKQLVNNLDNAPECNGRRSQFLLRMTKFADLTGLCVRLVYYLPYST